MNLRSTYVIQYIQLSPIICRFSVGKIDIKSIQYGTGTTGTVPFRAVTQRCVCGNFFPRVLFQQIEGMYVRTYVRTYGKSHFRVFIVENNLK